LISGGFIKQTIAQIGLPLVKNYTPDEYKGGIQNWQITQDERGVIYVANNFGLLQYDGNDWKSYPIQGISKLRCIAYKSSGRIYTGSQGDFGYFEPDSLGSLIYRSLKSSIPIPYQNIGETWKTYVLNDNVYFCTFDHIYIYNTISGFIEVVSNNSILDISYTCNNKVYTYVPNKGLSLLDGSTLIDQPYTKYFSEKVVSGVISHNTDELMITTSRHGIYITSGSIVKPWNAELNKLFSETFINSAILLSNGNLVIGTQHNGIYIVNQEGEILLNMAKDSGLLSRTILSLYEDDNQNLWIGQNNGISFIQLKSPFTLINEESNLPGTGYTSYLKDDLLYMGTNNGVYLSDMHENIQIISGSEGQAYSLQFIKDDLYVGHNNGAMKIINNTAKRIGNLTTGNWMFLEFNDYLLNGTYEGIEIMASKGAKSFGNIDSLRESSRILAQSNDSTIWMSHVYKGVYKIVFHGKSIDSTSVEYFNENNGLPSNLFNMVHIIEGELKISTDAGIYSFDHLSNTFKIDVRLTKYFTGDRISDLKTDVYGNIYFITTTSVGFLEKKGIGGYEKHTAPFHAIRDLLNDDLPNINIIGPNLVFFGAKEGFVVFDRNQFWTTEHENFKTMIRRVQHKGESTTLLYDGNPTKGKLTHGHLDNPEEVTYNNNTIIFSFAASSFNPNSAPMFQYKLLGFDKNWQEWTESNFKEYTNLREGLYTFQVKSRNANNSESEVVSYSLIIIYPWYRSPIAYIIYVLLAIFVFAGIIMSIDKRHELEKKNLEQKRHVELKAKELQLAKIARESEGEINKLSKEKLESNIKHMDTELATNTMHILNKNEFINGIKSTLGTVIKKSSNDEVKKQINRIIKNIEKNIKTDGDWQNFQIHFEKVHGDFSTRLKQEYPSLSPQEVKLSAYLRLNLSTKEIANLLNISMRGVEIGRYRLRKKLNLDRSQNLAKFILNY
jgi:ligand-binding sensor domain-containing protein/DNA-binding CsgD family transcriptional regulator